MNRFIIVKIIEILTFLNSTRILNKYLWQKNLTIIQKFENTKLEIHIKKKVYK